jgi:hypothetical protein
MNQIQYDEIDLFQFFKMLWDGKWFISASIMLTTLIGFGFTQLKQPEYTVSIPYSFNIYSMSTLDVCNNNIECLNSQSNNRLLNYLRAKWDLNSSLSKKNIKGMPYLSISTTIPLDLSKYKAQIKSANIELTNNTYLEAKASLSFIYSEMGDALLSTEKVAEATLNAKRVIVSIDSGQNAISFGRVSIVKSKPYLYLFISGVVGGMLGILFIVVRNAINKRKEHLSKA